MAKPKKITMRVEAHGTAPNFYWGVFLSGVWLEPAFSKHTKEGSQALAVAWARREYGPDVVIEWNDG